MLKSLPHVIKKPALAEYDSADDLDASGDEDDIISQKLPESRVKLSTKRFSSNGILSGNQGRRGSNSPLREMNMNNLPRPANYNRDDQNEAIKKMIYGKSPKEAANEYMMSIKQHSAQPQLNAGRMNKITSSPPKSKAHTLSANFVNPNNKENVRQDENSYASSKLYVEEPEGQPSAFTELSNKIYTQKLYGNTQQRQTKIAQPTNDNLLLSVNDAQKIEEARYLASRNQQDDVVNRLIKQGEIMSEHSKALTNAYLNKELEECTFAPRVTTSSKPRRNFNQFLEDQKQFQSQVELKKRKLKEKSLIEKIKDEPSYKPEICQNSVKMLEKKKKTEKGPVHQRLYNIGKNAQTKHMQGIAGKDDLSTNRESIESSHFIGLINTKGDLSSSSLYDKSLKEGNSRFTPNIQKKSKNLKRDDRIDDILYKDALRRQHKVVEASKMKSRSTVMPGMSMASRRALAMRFIKEFDIAVLEFLEVGKEPKLNYLQLNEFLRKLCFLKESEQVENPHFTPERLLMYDMWYLLHADKHGGVHRRNLLVFLLAILNLHFPITKIQNQGDEENQNAEMGQAQNQEEEDQENDANASLNSPFLDQNKNPILPEGSEQLPHERRIIGSFDEVGNYEVTEDDVKKLHKVYELWYLNRLCSGDNIGQLISTRTQQEFTYHPEINEASRNLAQAHREKILEGTAELIRQNKIPEPKDGKISHVDLLIVSKKVLEEKVNRYGEMLQEEQVRDCTFKPQITHYDSHNVNSSSIRPSHDETGYLSRDTHSKRQNAMTADSMGRDRVFELYSLAKPRILKKDKDAQEVDFEKNMDECTFHPNIVTKKDSRSTIEEPKEYFAKGIEKAVERMRHARSEREQVMAKKERGFTTGAEGSFVFALDKKKFGSNDPLKDRSMSTNKGQSRTGSRMQYKDNSYEHEKNPSISYNQASMMRGDGADERYDEDYMTYEHQMNDYGNSVYRIEQDDDLKEVKEDENEAEQLEHYNEEQDYGQEREEQGQESEQPLFNRDSEQQGGEGEDERVPLLFVDVNLGLNRTERIVVFEGDKSEDLAEAFAQEHGLDLAMRARLKELLDSQIAGLLSRIDEEEMNSGLSETERHQQSEQNGGEQEEEDDY